jgi:hypothetical protein
VIGSTACWARRRSRTRAADLDRRAHRAGSAAGHRARRRVHLRWRRPTLHDRTGEQSLRPQVAARGKPDFSFNAVAYIAIGGERELAEAVAHHQRYYPVLPVPAEQAIHHGTIDKIKDTVAEYAASGLDLLVLMPEVRSLQQLELLAEHILPEYRH